MHDRKYSVYGWYSYTITLIMFECSKCLGTNNSVLGKGILIRWKESMTPIFIFFVI